MQKCTCSNLYENKILREALGETLRPGGYVLTERAVKLICIKEGSRVMDIGSGMGDTVNYLNNHGFNATGAEPSDILIEESRKKYKGINILKGAGEKLPTDDDSMEAIFAECTMSLMDDLDKVLEECHRVLRTGGYFVITDVYARNTEHLKELDQIKFKSCLRGMLDLKKFIHKLESKDFNIMINEDHTDCLKQLTVSLIFKFGSMGMFWSKMSGCYENMGQFRDILTRCKPGYFLIVCKKN